MQESLSQFRWDSISQSIKREMKKLKVYQKFNEFLVLYFIHINLIKRTIQFIEGNFDQVSYYLQQTFTKNDFSLLVKGLLLWIKGCNDQSLQLIKSFSEDFPLIQLVISWIYQEQSEKNEAQILYLNLSQQFPKLDLFCLKHAFITSGPYSKFIQDNKEKLDHFDNKKFYAIKIVPTYLESKAFSPLIIIKYNNLALQMLVMIEKYYYASYPAKKIDILESFIYI